MASNSALAILSLSGASEVWKLGQESVDCLNPAYGIKQTEHNSYYKNILGGEAGVCVQSHQCSCCTERFLEGNREPIREQGNLPQVFGKHFHVCLDKYGITNYPSHLDRAEVVCTVHNTVLCHEQGTKRKINPSNIKKTPWSESASELYRPSDRRLSAK
jgi:hypothetical protein